MKKQDKRKLKEVRRTGQDFCPACGLMNLERPLALNSVSRYVPVYICNGCGNREAFEGDFWHGSEARRADERAKTNIRILRLMDQ